MTDDHVVLMNLFEVPDHSAEEFTAAWEKANDYLKAQPGYRGTVLHRSISPGAVFTFVNIAQWDTPQLFQRAIADEQFQALARPMEAYKPRPGLYRAVRH